LSQYSMKSGQSAAKQSSLPTLKLFKSTGCQETRGEKQVQECCNSSDLDREESSSFHSMLETSFSSMSSMQRSRHASTQNASAHHLNPPEQRALHQQPHQEQDFTILRCFYYLFIASFLDHLLERLILTLQRHIHRVPILLRLKFVKTLVKGSTGDFYHTSTLSRTQSILEHVYANELAVETVSSARIVKTSSFLEANNEEWGHFADFQE
jgi:hypothetical protein